MNPHWNSYLNRTLSRRELLRVSSTGFGALALAGLLGEQLQAAGTAGGGAVSPLAVKPPHFEPKAKRVIFLFMHGGPSQVDTFDYKPLLQRDHGRPLPFKRPKVVSSETFNLLKSPWAFQQHGHSGAWVSELFPHFARQVELDAMFLVEPPDHRANLAPQKPFHRYSAGRDHIDMHIPCPQGRRDFQPDEAGADHYGIFCVFSGLDDGATVSE